MALLRLAGWPGVNVVIIAIAPARPVRVATVPTRIVVALLLRIRCGLAGKHWSGEYQAGQHYESKYYWKQSSRPLPHPPAPLRRPRTERDTGLGGRLTRKYNSEKGPLWYFWVMHFV